MKRIFLDKDNDKWSFTFCSYGALDRLYPRYNLCKVSEVSSWTRAGLRDTKSLYTDIKDVEHLFNESSSTLHIILRRECRSYVGSLAVVVVGRAVVLQHVLDDVASGPASEQQLAVLVAHILR